MNITKCYCEGLDEDVNQGHFYQFDYRNFHNAQVYSVAWTCDSDATTTGWEPAGPKRLDFPVPVCWNAHDSWRKEWRKEKRKQCMKSFNADIFCFELGNTQDPFDYYYFNYEKRGLPNFGIVEHSPDQCVAVCRDQVGGKVVASECPFFVQTCLVTYAFCFREETLSLRCPGDTKGGWEKSLPSMDNHLTTLRSSYQTYTALDDIIANPDLSAN